MNTDGTNLATVFTTPMDRVVHQLAIDEALQRIYFTRAVSASRGEQDGDRRHGGGQLQPHTDGLGRGFALDPASQQIFLTSHTPTSPASGGGLWVYDIVEDRLTQLISDPETGYWDVELDLAAQRVYWTDYGRGQVRSAKFDGTDVQIVLGGLTNPYGLTLEFAESPQPVPEPGTLTLLASVGIPGADHLMVRAWSQRDGKFPLMNLIPPAVGWKRLVLFVGQDHASHCPALSWQL